MPDQPLTPISSSLPTQQEEEAARKANPNKQEVELDADLRANYYYPTARKR